MLEQVKRHVEEYKLLEDSAIPLCLLYEKGKSGESICVKAAKEILRNKLEHQIQELSKETVSKLVDDPEMLSYLGKMKQKGIRVEKCRIQTLYADAEEEKLSKYPYEQVEQVLSDTSIENGNIYYYLKYYAAFDFQPEEKEQLLKSLSVCIEWLDFEKTDPDIRLLLINPAFSSNLLQDLCLEPSALQVLKNPELMQLVNELSVYCGQEESLNRNHLEQLYQNTKRIQEKLDKVLSYIPRESQTPFFTLWLWNSALLEDLCQLEKLLTESTDTDTLFSGRAAYVNALYGNPLTDFDFSYFPNKKTELFLYAITNRKKSFLKLAQEQEELLLDLPDGSMLFEPDIYRNHLNLNTLNAQNLKDCYGLVGFKQRLGLLEQRWYTFEELKQLNYANVKEMELYGYLTCEKSDEKLCILKELLKKKCVPVKFSTEQLQKVAKSLSEKRLSRWMQEEFQNITDLKPVTAMWLLASLDDLHGFEKEITKDKQVYFLLRDKELLSQCDSVSGLKELLCKQDSSWKSLKEELMLTEEFQTENQERIQEFLFEGGAEIMAAYLKSRSCKQEEIRRLVVAELLGKFSELKYPAGDLEREIAYPITSETENEWKNNLCRSAGSFLAKEETGLLPVMQIGEIPIYSCLSYIDGTNNECLLSCFDSNKKLLFIEKNGETVFRAILRLTKGSYEGETEQKKIEFADMLNPDSEAEEMKEELVLFLERYYQKGLKELDVFKAAQLAIALAEEKAKKLGARLVLSSYYNSVLPTGKGKYVSSIYYLYISASKNGKQYLDSLGGTAGISSSESYKSNRFYIENK